MKKYRLRYLKVGVLYVWEISVTIFIEGKTPKYGNQKIFTYYSTKMQIIGTNCILIDVFFSDTDLYFKNTMEVAIFFKKGDIIINSTGGGTVGRTGYIDDSVFDKFDKVCS